MKVISGERLISHIENESHKKSRILVAIAGPPGSGKSRLTRILCEALQKSAIVPMDGFHFDNHTLSARGRLDKKGAPDTFDAIAFSCLLERIQAGGKHRVPVFDRATDQVVEAGATIEKDVGVALVEGNYLLLNFPPWLDLQRFWDVTVMLDVSEDELERRLIRRWVRYGLSPQEAIRRARHNDLPNAITVKEQSLPAHFRLISE